MQRSSLAGRSPSNRHHHRPLGVILSRHQSIQVSLPTNSHIIYTVHRSISRPTGATLQYKHPYHSTPHA